MISRNLGLLGVLAFSTLPAAAQSMVRASVSSNGLQGNAPSGRPSMSVNGRFVAFESYASVLVPFDFNSKQDVFVMDLSTGLVDCASASLGGPPGNSDSNAATISRDGRYVSFESDASNLVTGDTQGTPDVFVRDRQAHTTVRVSLTSSGQPGFGAQLSSMSADGTVVSFASSDPNFVPGDANGTLDVFVRDMTTGTTEIVSIATNGTQGDLPSYSSALSFDGRFVAFTSSANTLAGAASPFQKVFLRDRAAGTTILISEAPGGVAANLNSLGTAVSADGRYVVFSSDASNLVVGDYNNRSDVFLRDVVAGTTEFISVSSGGALGNNSSYHGFPSADFRYVVFQSDAQNLASQPLDFSTDIFLRDRQAGTTSLLSGHSNSGQPDQNCVLPVISGDAHRVAFVAAARNMVAGDINEARDVLVWSDLPTPAAPTTYGIGHSLSCTPAISINGATSLSSMFHIQCTSAPPAMAGLLLYGFNGSASVPFSGGTLYVNAPIRRTPAQTSQHVSTIPYTCLGSFAINMNQFAMGALGGHPSPGLSVPGATINCQWWGRDGPYYTQFSNGLEYAVAP